MVVEDGTFFCELEGLRFFLDQVEVQAIFQESYFLANGRLGDVILFSRFGEICVCDEVGKYF
jgi:hypothetical protein